MSKSLFARMTAMSGPAAVAWYVLFTGLAWLKYPGAYGPWNNNWLSDLGNRQLNSGGAELYAIGCVGTGIFVGAFFAGLASWRGSGARVRDGLVLFVKVAGLTGALSIVMSAVFSIDQFAMHQFWSRMLYGCMAVALFISPFALRRPDHRIWPVAAVAAAGYVSIVVSLLFPTEHWLEWPSIGFLLLYLLVVASAGRVWATAHPARLRARRPWRGRSFGHG